MESRQTEPAAETDRDPALDLYVQALHHVDALAADPSEDVTSARLWALFLATTARLRYRGAPRSGFAAAFEDGCRAAEAALRADLEEARERVEEGSRTPAVLRQFEAPPRLM